jgi:kynurenine 3-monooxygenase
MNSGFEDISILNEMMEKYGDDWEMIFLNKKSRKPNADAMQNSRIVILWK